MSDGILIAGGGLAGQRCAETLRRCGYEGRIRIVGAEPHRPYDRPPLSKAVLVDADADDAVGFRPAHWYEQHGVELELGVAAAALDCARRILTLADGRALRYEQLLIATGSRPRRLPPIDRFANVHTLRTLDDARALRGALSEGGRLVIVGGGFIGQEVAAAAVRAGLATTIVEAAAAPLQAVLGQAVGAWFADLHRAHGVDVILGEEVVAAHGSDATTVLTRAGRTHAGSQRERVEALTLASGQRLPCDHVLVGIGVEPDVGWLGGSPLAGPVVPVDADGRTAAPGVFAAGDAAAAYDPDFGRHVAGGHWEAAGRQGIAAARAMLGLEAPRRTPASFWSDLYDTRVHYLGHARLADGTTVDGDPTARDFSITFTRAGAPVAVLLVGRSHDLPNARALLAA